jgi:hypothetical protein
MLELTQAQSHCRPKLRISLFTVGTGLELDIHVDKRDIVEPENLVTAESAGSKSTDILAA